MSWRRVAPGTGGAAAAEETGKEKDGAGDAGSGAWGQRGPRTAVRSSGPTGVGRRRKGRVGARSRPPDSGA